VRSRPAIPRLFLAFHQLTAIAFTPRAMPATSALSARDVSHDLANNRMRCVCGAVMVTSMDVTFTKADGRRYMMTVVRERGPQLAPRYGPGYHDYLPHDAVHFLVEAEANLSGGAFGRIAAGRNNIFWPADPKVRRHQTRREAKSKPSAIERAEMGRSEELASICQPLWELRAGHRRQLPEWFTHVTPGAMEVALAERILARLDEFAACWHALPVGGKITLSWPLDGQRHVAPRARSRRSRV
jgi:hypothetical protein